MGKASGARRRDEAGYTLFEIMFAFVVAAFFLGVSAGIIRSATGITDDDRQRTQLVNDHRRNFEYLTNLLRNADPATLTGFDAGTGVALDVWFQRPTGATDGVRALGPTERLVWRPAPIAVSGISRPGDVFHITPAGERVAAARVPQGGFSVTQQGRALSVRLTTYQAVGGEDALRVSSTIKVSMRN
jgi:hypothetical protein